MDLGRPGLLSRVSSVGSDSSSFGKGNPPSDPPKSVFQGKDLPKLVFGSVRAVWASGSVFGFWWTTLLFVHSEEN